MNQSKTDKLVRLPNGCWQIANDSRSLFAADFFDRFPQHRLAGQARAIVAAERTGQNVRVKPLTYHNLKGK